LKNLSDVAQIRIAEGIFAAVVIAMMVAVRYFMPGI